MERNQLTERKKEEGEEGDSIFMGRDAGRKV